MYSQSNFFYGGMNSDDEDRLIPNSDYREAYYSRSYSSGSSDNGALQSMTGNILRPNQDLPNGKNVIIGSCEDIEGKGYGSGNLILFIANSLNDHTIWRYNVITQTYTCILRSSILNFKLENRIYHAAVVDGLLYWTDNYFNSYSLGANGVPDFNPPRKINIEKAIVYTQTGGTDPRGYSEITFDNLDWIKHPPLFSPYGIYTTDTTESSNNLKNKLFQFRYQYIYDDKEESAWSPISDLILPNESEYISGTTNISPYIDNNIELTISTGSSIAKIIRVAFRIGNNSEFHLYKEFIKSEEGWSDYSNVTINFKNETAGIAISNSERNYDLVPQIANCVEYLPSNEFAIGNIVEGYDKIDISETDFSISQSRVQLNNIHSFAQPSAVFWNLYNAGGARHQVISFYSYTDSPSLFFKYKISEGDIVILQLKEITSGFVTGPINNILPVIYYTVPAITGTDDLDYMNNLCIDLSNYLESIGIPASVSPPGTYTISSVSVTWPTVSIDWGTLFPLTSSSYTWFNFTQYQLETSNATNYTQSITVLRKNEATRTFKTGATHEFAIQYYDRANRDGTVQIIPTGSVHVPFNTDLSYNELNLPSDLNRSPYLTTLEMNINSDFLPPIWATNYQILYKPSTNISNFQQRSVIKATYNPDSTVKLELDNYYKSNYEGASINQTPSKGDFVRFVRKRALFNKENKTIAIEKAQNEPLIISHVGAGNYSIDLSPYYSTVYDPSSIFSSGQLIAPSSGTYTLKANLLLTLDFPVGYLPTSINGGLITDSSVVGSQVFDTYSNSNVNQAQITINIEGEIQQVLTAGDDIAVAFTFLLTGTPFPSLLSATLINSEFKVMLGSVDYGDYKYYPEYVSEESNALELNVLEYNVGDDNQTESITVNYFDISILGDYLTYTGSNDNRGFASGGFQIEIYTPKKETENDPWYETGIEWEIIDPHTEFRVHDGDTPQVQGNQDAVINLDCGDVYIRQRIMATGYKYDGAYEDVGDANDNRAAWFCEDPHYSDYYISNWNNKGRLGLYSPFAKRQELKTTVYHTNSLIDNSQINGLSQVEFQNQVSLKDEFGAINRLMHIGDTLKAFQDRKISSIYVQKAFGLNGDGTNNVVISDQTFATVRPHDDDYGCIHPGSIIKSEGNIYVYDYYNSTFVAVTPGGIFNMCNGTKKFMRGAITFTDLVNDSGGLSANIQSHINRSTGEYIIYSTRNSESSISQAVVVGFKAPDQINLSGDVVSQFPVGTFVSVYGAVNSGNNVTNVEILSSSYNAGLNVTQIVVDASSLVAENPGGKYFVYMYYNNFIVRTNGLGLVYSYILERWVSWVNHGVLHATQLGNKFFTVGDDESGDYGSLYEENSGSELTFYGLVRQQQVRFVFNEAPSVVKRFYTHLQQANYPFSVEVSIPASQTYPLGMLSDIPEVVLKNQEGYFVSRYYRDSTDPKYPSAAIARLNGRELRGYVLNHILYNSNPDVKKILMNVGVNFAPSEPLFQ